MYEAVGAPTGRIHPSAVGNKANEGKTAGPLSAQQYLSATPGGEFDTDTDTDTDVDMDMDMDTDMNMDTGAGTDTGVGGMVDVSNDYGSDSSTDV